MAVTTDGLVREFVGAYAKGSAGPNGNADAAKATWTDLRANGDITWDDGAYTTADGWAGAGSEADPYCIIRSEAKGMHGTLAEPDCFKNDAAAWTFEMWIKTALASPAANKGFFFCRSAPDGFRIYQAVPTTTIEASIGNGTTETWPNAGGDCTAAWQHVTFVSTGAAVRVYLGHAQVGSDTAWVYSGYTGTPEIFATADETEQWDGCIATLRIYSKALSHAEIDANDAEGILGVGSSVAPAAWPGLTVTRLLQG